jgi:predicted ester cyclase
VGIDDLRKWSLIMLEENKALVRRYYQEVMGDLSGIDEIVSADFVDHHFPPDMPPGPAGVKKFFTGFARSVFSEMRIEIDFLLAEDDKVDCHFVFCARHTGEFAGIAPRGNAIRLPAISTFRVAGGKLAEAWEIFDAGSLRQQMQADEAG